MDSRTDLSARFCFRIKINREAKQLFVLKLPAIPSQPGSDLEIRNCFFFSGRIA